MGARREVVSAVTERYRSAKRAEKGRMLDAATSLAMEAQIVRARLAMRVERRLKCAVNLVLPVISERYLAG
jgi:hypothetical protein